MICDENDGSRSREGVFMALSGVFPQVVFAQPGLLGDLNYENRRFRRKMLGVSRATRIQPLNYYRHAQIFFSASGP